MPVSGSQSPPGGSVVCIEIDFFILGHWNIQGSLYIRDNVLQESLGLEHISTGDGEFYFQDWLRLQQLYGRREGSWSQLL